MKTGHLKNEDVLGRSALADVIIFKTSLSTIYVAAATGASKGRRCLAALVPMVGAFLCPVTDHPTVSLSLPTFWEKIRGVI